MKEIFRTQNPTAISRQVPRASLLDTFAINWQKALVDESEMIRTQTGTRD
jgi:hypothetical protein